MNFKEYIREVKYKTLGNVKIKIMELNKVIKKLGIKSAKIDDDAIVIPIDGGKDIRINYSKVSDKVNAYIVDKNHKITKTNEINGVDTEDDMVKAINDTIKKFGVGGSINECVINEATMKDFIGTDLTDSVIKTNRFKHKLLPKANRVVASKTGGSGDQYQVHVTDDNNKVVYYFSTIPTEKGAVDKVKNISKEKEKFALDVASINGVISMADYNKRIKEL